MLKRPRIRHLHETYAKRLLKAFREREDGPEAAWAKEGVDSLFARFLEQDPSGKGRYLQWILRLYLDDSLKAEDLYKVSDILTAFEKAKPYLPVKQRDVNAYGDLQSMWRASKRYADLEEEEPTSREQRRADRAQARSESEILHDEGGWIVTSPQTRFAAQWWGRGTIWCTSMRDQEHHFEHYANQGPLWIFVRPDGAKFQFHAPGNQFHDASDAGGDMSVAFAGAPDGFLDAVREVIMRCVKGEERWPTRDPRTVLMFPSEIPGRACWLAAVSEMPELVSDAPEEEVDEEMGLLLVSRRASLLGILPVAVRTPKVCAKAVAAAPTMLKHVPEKLRTTSLCRDAVASGAVAIAWVPAPLRTPSLCLRAVRENGLLLGHVPERHRTARLCRTAVESNGQALADVPARLRTRALCLTAVRGDSRALKDVPLRFLDDEMERAAGRETSRSPEPDVSNAGTSLSHVVG